MLLCTKSYVKNRLNYPKLLTLNIGSVHLKIVLKLICRGVGSSPTSHYFRFTATKFSLSSAILRAALPLKFIPMFFDFE